MPEKPKDAVPIYTSIPKWLYDLLHESAKKNRRSIAAELALAIEKRLVPRKKNS